MAAGTAYEMTNMPPLSTAAPAGIDTSRTTSAVTIPPNASFDDIDTQSPPTTPTQESSPSVSRRTIPEPIDQRPAQPRPTAIMKSTSTQSTNEQILSVARTIWAWLNGTVLKWLVGCFTTAGVGVGIYFAVDAKRISSLALKDQFLATCIGILENGLALSPECNAALAETGEHGIQKRGPYIGECDECPTCLIDSVSTMEIMKFFMWLSTLALVYVLVPIRRVYKVDWSEHVSWKDGWTYEVEANISYLMETHYKKDARERKAPASTPRYSLEYGYTWTQILMIVPEGQVSHNDEVSAVVRSWGDLCRLADKHRIIQVFLVPTLARVKVTLRVCHLAPASFFVRMPTCGDKVSNTFPCLYIILRDDGRYVSRWGQKYDNSGGQTLDIQHRNLSPQDSRSSGISPTHAGSNEVRHRKDTSHRQAADKTKSALEALMVLPSRGLLNTDNGVLPLVEPLSEITGVGLGPDGLSTEDYLHILSRCRATAQLFLTFSAFSWWTKLGDLDPLPYFPLLCFFYIITVVLFI